MRFIFDVDFHGEQDAGLNSYTDTIAIDVESASPGGEPGEFAEHMRQALAEWFDGASVQLRSVKARPDFLAQALNEGDGVYRP